MQMRKLKGEDFYFFLPVKNIWDYFHQYLSPRNNLNKCICFLWFLLEISKYFLRGFSCCLNVLELQTEGKKFPKQNQIQKNSLFPSSQSIFIRKNRDRMQIWLPAVVGASSVTKFSSDLERSANVATSERWNVCKQVWSSRKNSFLRVDYTWEKILSGAGAGWEITGKKMIMAK